MSELGWFSAFWTKKKHRIEEHPRKNVLTSESELPRLPKFGINKVIPNMKTAISLPEDLFRLAENAARRLRVSRSKLYATAIAEFLNKTQDRAVTDRLNEVYSRRPAKLDAALHRAQMKSPEKDSW
jgi:hypothetical protein